MPNDQSNPSELEIWIVDDDEAVRLSLAALLDSEGFVTRCFAQARAFLDFVTADSRGCLVSDVRMPGLSGLDLQRALLEMGISVPIIFMTGHADVPMAVDALKAGASDFIEKPFANQVMIDSLRAALRQFRQAVPGRRDIGGLLARRQCLTEREREVMDLVVKGLSNKEIARLLGISPRTVDIHRGQVMGKMKAESLPDLVRIAMLIDPALLDR